MLEPISTIAASIISILIYDLARKGIENLSSISPLRKAIDQTADDFKNFEGLANTLYKWIEKEEVLAELRKFEEGGRDISTVTLAVTMVEKAGFYCGEESTAVAKEILSKFFANLNEQYLKSKDGHVYQTIQIEQSRRQIIERIDEQTEALKRMTLTGDQMVGTPGVPSAAMSEVKPEGIAEKLLSEIDALLKEGKPKTAKELSLKALSDLRKRTPIPEEALFKTYTLLAACERDLGDENKTAEYFEMAYYLRPHDTKARINVALAHMLRGKPHEGLPQVEGVLKQEPDNLRALAAKAILLSASGRGAEAASLFSDRCLLDKNTCITFVDVFLRIGDFEKAREVLRGFKTRFGETVEYSYMSAHAVATPVLQALQERKAFSWQMGEADRKNLESARQMLSESITKFRSGEGRTGLVEALLLRSAILIALRQPTEAVADTNEILGVDGGNVAALNNRGIALLSASDYEGAIDSFSKAIAEGGSVLDLVPRLCHAHLANEAPQEAIDTLLKHLGPEEDIIANLDLGFILAEAYIALPNPHKANSIIEQLTLKHGEEPSVIYLSARQNKTAGKTRDAEQLLLKAIQKSQGAERQSLTLELADMAYDAKEFDKALPLYDEVAKKDVLNRPLERYAHCLYMTGRIYECFDLCKSLREVHGVMGFMSQLEAAIHEELGSLSQAEDLYKDLIKQHPNLARFKMNLGMLYFRGRKEAEALDLLKQAASQCQEGYDLSQISLALRALGLTQPAIETGYRALSLKPHDPRVHLSYIALFFFMPDSETERLQPRTVSQESVVTLRTNGQQETWILVASEMCDPAKRELSTLHGVGAALLGHEKADKLEVESAGLMVEYEILSVESKYVHKFREVLTGFSTSFAEEKGLRKMKVGKDLKEIRDLVDESHSHMAATIDFYRAGKLTIGALSKILGRGIFNTWAYLMTDPHLWIQSDTGKPSHQLQEKHLAVSAEEVCADLLGLLTLANLKRLEILPEMFEQILVTQSTQDELTDAELECQRSLEKKGHTTLFTRDGEYYKHEVTPERIQTEIDFISRIKRFIGDHCKIRAVNPRYASRRRLLSEIIGDSSADTVLLSLDNDTPILTDDYHLRVMAYAELKAKGFSSQSLLRAAFEKSILTRDELNEAIETLLFSDYRYVSISGDFLLYVAEKGSFHVSDYNMHRALSIIESPETTPGSAVIVVAEFIVGIWINVSLLEMKLMYLDLALVALVKRRSSRRLLARLKGVVQIKCTILPVHAREIIQGIDDWQKSRLLIY